MMKDTKLSRMKIVFVIAATLLVVLYVYLVAPAFLSDINELRTENKQIEHDLSEIKKMGSDSKIINEQIEETQSTLDNYKKRADMNSSTFDMIISEKASKTNVTISEMQVDDPVKVENKNGSKKTLIRQPVSISIEGDFKNGISFMKSLEKSKKGIFKVNEFLYSNNNESREVMNWMINVDAYYYEN